MRSGMILTGCVLCYCLLPVRSFGDEKFPYTAVIESATAYVRSGPGEQYYPTTRLREGDTVVVHRHDPGGWYMIAPPEGSFSWVPAKFVDIVGQGEGEILDENVAVFVGTDFGDDHTVFQRRLSPGETVRVLGERELQTRRGREKMYRIAPPRREWRWVAGRSLVRQDGAANVAQRKTKDDQRNLFIDKSSKQRDWKNRNKKDSGIPLTPAERKRADDAADPALKVASRDGKILNGRKLLEYLSADRRRLEELDKQFKSIVLGAKEKWDFRELNADYQQLEKETNSPQLRRQLESRFAALKRYRAAKRKYDEFVALLPPPEASKPQKVLRDASNDEKKLVGAGIVQRSVAPGLPRYMLVSPEGKILSYLVPSSKVDLGKHIGQPRGIQGERFFRPEISADQIIVDALKPVRLKNETAKKENSTSVEQN